MNLYLSPLVETITDVKNADKTPAYLFPAVTIWHTVRYVLTWTAARLWSWELLRCCCWRAAVCSIKCCCWAAYICWRYWAAELGGRCNACWITCDKVRDPMSNQHLNLSFPLWFRGFMHAELRLHHWNFRSTINLTINFRIKSSV